LLYRNITVINLIQNSVEYSSLKVESVCRRSFGGSSVWVVDITDQLLIRYSSFVRCWRKNGRK
jgi:hypothetical protein